MFLQLEVNALYSSLINVPNFYIIIEMKNGHFKWNHKI